MTNGIFPPLYRTVQYWVETAQAKSCVHVHSCQELSATVSSSQKGSSVPTSIGNSGCKTFLFIALLVVLIKGCKSSACGRDSAVSRNVTCGPKHRIIMISSILVLQLQKFYSYSSITSCTRSDVLKKGLSLLLRYTIFGQVHRMTSKKKDFQPFLPNSY